MKTCLTIAMGLAFATAVVRGQDLPTYQSTINSQSPYYYNNLDNSLAPSVGTGTLIPSSTGTGFTNDYFGNANAAAYFTNTSAQLSIAAGNNIIANSGTSVNAIGSMSLLFYTPNTNGNTTTRYIFSDGDSNPEFYLKIFGTNDLIMGAGSKTITNSTTLSLGTWYYFAATWNFTGSGSSAFGINYYLGVAGQATNTLTAGFTERGGSGGISTSAFLGNGGTFTLSGEQVGGGGYQVGGIPGMVDELATWSNQLSVAQIDNQYSTLILVPEPSTLLLCGFAFVGLCAGSRRRRSVKK